MYLNEEAVAYSFNLSEGSRQAFEEVGGFKAFQRMMRSSRMALDLGTLVARIDGTNEATVFAVIYQDPAWTMFRLVREDGLWKIVARPGSHDKTVIYPSVLDGEVSK
ncbi:MAG: hypothetical protein O3A46_01275 [Candidatus Poribacteria bacterium]|nr:hypothetical protein [Candidatus Poribacteria bacterium]